MNRIFVALLLLLSFASSVFGHNEHRNHSGTAGEMGQAPFWSVLNSDGSLTSSNQFEGRGYLLVLHYGETCIHCSEQLGKLSQYEALFNQCGFEVVTVSNQARDDSDSSSQSQLLLGHDPSLNLFRNFGAMSNESNQPMHGSFLIDETGRIRWSDIGKHAYQNIESLLAEARLVSAGSTTTQEDKNKNAPRIFFNKPPHIVAYQLNRLSNSRLLLVERKTDDPKYAPVYSTILTRNGVSRETRQQALDSLTQLNNSDIVTELTNAIGSIKTDNARSKRVARELSRMLVLQPKKLLARKSDVLLKASQSPNSTLSQAGFAGMIVAKNPVEAAKNLENSEKQRLAWLNAISLLPSAELKNSSRDSIVDLLVNGDSARIKKAAVSALKHVQLDQAKTYELVAPFAMKTDFRNVAVETLLKIGPKFGSETTNQSLATSLTEYAETTPAKKRTTDSFVEAMSFADQIISTLPTETGSKFRRRLEKVTVRVVQILTVVDEMRYDLPYFAVEAGRPVQVVLKNIDQMAHNLVICKPGKLKQVANEGLAVGIQQGRGRKPYVPKSKDVLFATNMIQAQQQERLTFNAPKKPGEYPYVCTFPQHWPRMYGVMVVVDDLDEWLKNPIPPKDPIGSNRSFVKKWTVDELAPELERGIQGRSLEIGQRIFKEATCLQCHKIEDEGGAVGPKLDELFTKWKGDRTEVLTEILDPSHRIDEKYAMHLIMTLDGVTISGIIQSENEQTIELLDNPESTKPTIVLKDDIDEMRKTSKSIMPKALLDNFTKDEIFELMHYIEANQKK